MKNLVLAFEDKEFKEITKKKIEAGANNWKEFFMACSKISTKNLNMLIEDERRKDGT